MILYPLFLQTDYSSICIRITRGRIILASDQVYNLQLLQCWHLGRILRTTINLLVI